MNFETIAEYCMDNFVLLSSGHGMFDIFFSMYDGPTTVDDIYAFLSSLNRRTKETLAEKLKRRTMDSIREPVTAEEKLMVMMRLENAVIILRNLSEQTSERLRLSCTVSTKLEDEALLWATTCLWNATGYDYLRHAAEAMDHGYDCILFPDGIDLDDLSPETP